MICKRNGIRVNVSFHSMKAVQNDCRLWAKEIGEEFKPDAIVFLEKSGFLFARPLAEELGCPLYSVLVERPGNKAKDAIKKKLPYIPKFLLALALKSKSMYAYNEGNTKRLTITNARFDSAPLDKCKRVLLVDDSVDTGWSILAAKKLVQDMASNADVRIASYCVIDYSRRRVEVDYERRRNAIVMTATSRYSPEHYLFLKELDVWKSSFKH